jgi:hypothetical protein
MFETALLRASLDTLMRGGDHGRVSALRLGSTVFYWFVARFRRAAHERDRAAFPDKNRPSFVKQASRRRRKLRHELLSRGSVQRGVVAILMC